MSEKAATNKNKCTICDGPCLAGNPVLEDEHGEPISRRDVPESYTDEPLTDRERASILRDMFGG